MTVPSGEIDSTPDVDSYTTATISAVRVSPASIVIEVFSSLGGMG